MLRRRYAAKWPNPNSNPVRKGYPKRKLKSETIPLCYF